jgi:hypothetical protein
MEARTRVLLITHIVHHVADHIVVLARGIAILYARPPFLSPRAGMS